MIKLSILICSTHTRRKTFLPKCLDMVYGQWEQLPQSAQKQVEIMVLTDNKQVMLGAKRNNMIDICQGEYVSFVDDDDEIAPNYISSLLEATLSKADVITFTAMVSINGSNKKPCYYSKDNIRDYNTTDAYYRIPNHICCVRKEVSLKSSFPNILKGEDAGYAKLLLPYIKTEHKIDEVLYYYNYSDSTTETQMELPATIRKRELPPVADVVILSKADTPQMRNMTQNTINTCIAGANSLPVNVIVVEQVADIRYENAETIYHPTGDDFCYNANCNLGARQGSADWVLFCNNDLVFTGGFLHELITAEYPVVSPHEPKDPRQRGLTVNEVGEQNARHFSGWCFMMKRDFWNEIDGLCEDFHFWFSDDVTIQQCLQAGVKPMIVPKSVVNHLGSMTFKTLPQGKQEEYTWALTKLFNERYGQNKFHDNKYYQDYLKRTNK